MSVKIPLLTDQDNIISLAREQVDVNINSK